MSQAALFASLSLPSIALVIGLLAASNAQAINGGGLELGHGNDSTEATRISARWDWDKRWAIGQGWIAGGYWEAGLGYLQGDGAGQQEIWDVGFTPVFRLRSGLSKYYLEGAIGIHFLSKTRINAGRPLGTSFQFGDHIGFGRNFGEKDRYELGYRLQHISNGGLKEPNPGINFHLIRLGYHY